ncbi:MAG: radical SAM protein [Candidatus Omnitrophica bacterium CG11_big_fil_rev_8_21_14_0_20_45_26]|uniref:Radical SAM protein n=1 Tax=Candidatus Abzuiibacterium crystallinum TaxID=1974748 RepID=A0A2H0LRU0_9BACT|nr:MAG: radical SAM protein [Candidatus Omnitrophica bacterium CG11_big_fil_rev_8_21_14_0_20_45_26]PIW65340.1 MAG: radical SAM protein [Candidatus Omnitrophica bacterium CG12_big_fil_rev_8_21_14_0_65_45_16]
MNRFQGKLESADFRLTKGAIEILQVNLGKLCNMTCVHCHVEAGPTKTRENMNRRTAEAVAAYMKNSGIKTLDLTGGAPEMNPNFRYLVTEARQLGIHVIDRCNLTVLFLPGQEDLGQFLADNDVEIIASLPCYLQENVDKQRGKGAFDESIEALQILNNLGYGKEDSNLTLNLVYNPIGPHLPPDQHGLEKDYKDQLKKDWGVAFNRLYTITNMPITRYAKYLKAVNQYEAYVELLINSFNPATLEGLMCRDTISVGWDGRLYDCDFNQMLDMPLRNGKPITIHDVYIWNLEGRRIDTGNHCFGCTAGSGSSCQGALKESQNDGLLGGL